MEEIFKRFTTYAAMGVEGAGGILIVFAAIEALVRALPVFMPRVPAVELKDKIRLRLGRWLALALEFELAADILRTAVAPTWNEIGQLAAIAVLRTALNYFLQQEIAREARLEAGPAPAGPANSP